VVLPIQRYDIRLAMQGAQDLRALFAAVDQVTDQQITRVSGEAQGKPSANQKRPWISLNRDHGYVRRDGVEIAVSGLGSG